MSFSLDSRLEADCIRIHESEQRLLLLLNNALYYWFVIVPKVDVIEWFELDEGTQAMLNGEVNQLSRWLKESLGADKINVATIGNVVSQLHIHVIGRKENDAAWPGVVWGHPEKRNYSEQEIAALSLLVTRELKL